MKATEQYYEKKIFGYWFAAGYSFKSFAVGLSFDRFGFNLDLYPFFISMERPMTKAEQIKILKRLGVYNEVS